jgi:hypothetical protein
MGAEFEEKEPMKEVPKEVKHDETPKLFGDPKSYEHLPMEERIEMTKRMKSRFMSKLTLGERE